MTQNKLLPVLAVAGFCLAGCAALSNGGAKSSDRINITPSDRVFLTVAPFDSTVQAELTRVGLDPVKVRDNLAAELHYQMFLKKQEESPDSAGATVRVSISIRHLQAGTGNSGGFVAGTLLAGRQDVEKAEWEMRQPAKENVPADFLALHLPRTLAVEIMSRMKSRPKRSGTDLDYNPPLMLLR